VRRYLAFLFVLMAGVLIAQTPSIQSGSTIYIEPMDGYETDLAAALIKKGVRLVIVQDRAKADLIMQSTLYAHTPSPPVVVLSKNGTLTSGFPLAHDLPDSRTEANITVFEVRLSRIVFSCSVGKENDTKERRNTAEACAKHLKQAIVAARR
jgi:hypothetical protein